MAKRTWKLKKAAALNPSAEALLGKVIRDHHSEPVHTTLGALEQHGIEVV